jgi:indole-3-glycerol phosphate synthase
MNILDKIIATKRTEVEEKKKLAPVELLKETNQYKSPCNSLVTELMKTGVTGIIAEFKRKSPSKGIINDGAEVGYVTEAYQNNGACGISILTDEPFFGGSNEDLTYARTVLNIPILRKDFIIDEYQLVEAKSIGADVILLIAACLSPQRVRELALFAKQLGLEVLLEIHNEEELAHICDEADIVGVNNRDLKTFTVDVKRSIELSALIPADKIKISESGINDPDTIVLLKQYGFIGFLIGETFMKEQDPALAFTHFVHHLKKKTDDD